MVKNKIKQFIPCFITVAFSIVALFVYIFAMNGREWMRIFQAVVAPLVPLVIPVLNKIFKIEIPFAFNVAIGIYAVIAIDFASVMDFYGLIPWFYKFLHTAFGAVGGMGVFIFLLYAKGDKMKPWCFFLVILLVVLGLAAALEIYEFTFDNILGSDMQRWKPDMSVAGGMTVEEYFANYNPLTDTLWDMIVAIFGVFIFYALMFIDKLRGWKMCKSIYAQVHSTDKVPATFSENS